MKSRNRRSTAVSFGLSLVEQLESRVQLAATLSGGVITVTGSPGTGNAVTSTLNGTQLSLKVNGVTQNFSTAGVTRMVVTGGSHSDYIKLAATTPFAVSVNSGAGNDTVATGIGNDSINAGDGDDAIYSGGGNDSIDGGAGTDSADGGVGNDTATNVESRTAIESTGTPVPPVVTPPVVTPPVVTPPVVNPPVVIPPPSGSSIPVNASAAKPSPAITAMTTTGVVGQAFLVHGMNTSVGVGSIDTARLEWNFGDAGGKYNTLVGFNAGHVYTKAGTYTITLKVWNQSNGFAQTAINVNVAAAQRTQIYVSAAGSDSNSGASAASAVKSFSRAASLVSGKSNIEVLFRAGDTFSATNAMQLDGANVHVGSYGSGAKPTIRYDGPRGNFDIFRIARAANGASIDGLTIDSKYVGPSSDRSGMPFAIRVLGTRSAIRNVTFINVGYCVQTNDRPTGVMIQDCDAPTTYGLRAYLCWCEGTDFVILGNRVVNSTNEHPIRVSGNGVDRMLIAYNDLANPQSNSFETSKTCLNIQVGSYIAIENNILRGPRMQIGPLGGGDGLAFKSKRLHDVLFENNHVYDTTLEIDHGVSNIYIRNNIMELKNQVSMEVEGYNAQYARGVVNLNVVNNTIVNSGTTGRLMSVEGSVAGITLLNNIYRAPSMLVGARGTAAIFTVENSLSSFSTISNNVWPIPMMTHYASVHVPGGTGFAILGGDLNNLNNYYNIARWNALGQVGNDVQQTAVLGGANLVPSDPLITNGGVRVLGVFADFTGKGRPLTGPWSIGAIEV